MKLKFSRQILENFPNAKFHKNPSRGSWALCGQTYRRTDMTKPIDAFRNFANKPRSCCTFVVVDEMHLWLIERNTRLIRYHYEACQFKLVTLSGISAVWHWRGTTMSTESLVPPLYKNTSNQQSHLLLSVCTQFFRHLVGFIFLGVG
jgi:hypothetical protein